MDWKKCEDGLPELDTNCLVKFYEKGTLVRAIFDQRAKVFIYYCPEVQNPYLELAPKYYIEID